MVVAAATLPAQGDACAFNAPAKNSVVVEGDNNGGIFQSDTLSIGTIQQCVDCEFYVDDTFLLVNGLVNRRSLSDRTGLRPVPRIEQLAMAESIVSQALSRESVEDCIAELLRDQIRVSRFRVFRSLTEDEGGNTRETTVLAVSVTPATLRDYGLRVTFPVVDGLQRIWELGKYHYLKDGKCLTPNAYNPALCKQYEDATDFVDGYAIVGSRKERMEYAIIDREGQVVHEGFRSYSLATTTETYGNRYNLTDDNGRFAMFRTKTSQLSKFYDRLEEHESGYWRIKLDGKGYNNYAYGLFDPKTYREVLPPAYEKDIWVLKGGLIAANAQPKFSADGKAGFRLYKADDTATPIYSNANSGTPVISEDRNPTYYDINLKSSYGSVKTVRLSASGEPLLGPFPGLAIKLVTGQVVRMSDNGGTDDLYDKDSGRRILEVDDEEALYKIARDDPDSLYMTRKWLESRVIISARRGKIVDKGMEYAQRIGDGWFWIQGEFIKYFSPSGKTKVLGEVKSNIRLRRGDGIWGSLKVRPVTSELAYVTFYQSRGYGDTAAYYQLRYFFDLEKERIVRKDESKPYSRAKESRSSNFYSLGGDRVLYDSDEGGENEIYLIEGRTLTPLPYKTVRQQRGYTQLYGSNGTNLMMSDGTKLFSGDKQAIYPAGDEDGCRPELPLLVVEENDRVRLYDLRDKRYLGEALLRIKPFGCATMTEARTVDHELTFIDTSGRLRTPPMYNTSVEDIRTYGDRTYALLETQGEKSYDRVYGIYDLDRNAYVIPPSKRVSDYFTKLNEDHILLSVYTPNDEDDKYKEIRLEPSPRSPIPVCTDGPCELYRELMADRPGERE